MDNSKDLVILIIVICFFIGNCHDNKKEDEIIQRDVAKSMKSIESRVYDIEKQLDKMEQMVKKINDYMKIEDIGNLQEKIEKVARQRSGEKKFPELTYEQFELLWNDKDINGLFYYRDILKKAYPEKSELLLLEEEINKAARQRVGKRVYPDLTEEQFLYFWNLKKDHGKFIYRDILRSQDKYADYIKFINFVNDVKDILEEEANKHIGEGVLPEGITPAVLKEIKKDHRAYSRYQRLGGEG